MELRKYFQQFAMVTLALALGGSLSAAGENRLSRKTRLEQIREELARVLGDENVTIEREERDGAAESTDVRSVLDMMNAVRVHHGLRPLRLNARLSLAAADRSRDMLDRGYFDHVAPDGTQPFTWMMRRGYRYRAAGENLAVGYPTVEHLVSAWLESPAHRANLLGAQFDEVGLAIANASPVEHSRGPLVVALYAKEL